MSEPDDITARYGENPVALIKANLAAVEAKIVAACVRSGRPRSAVRLLPVSKTVPLEVVRLAAQLGLKTLGENKVQEAQSKAEAMADLNVSWSIIGHLQTNKVKSLISFASEFHALDSIRLAKLLNAKVMEIDRTLDVFVQVNTSGEKSKYGIAPDETESFVSELKQFPALRPRGLMTLAILNGQPDDIRACFKRLRGLRDKLLITDLNSSTRLLSMGMSGDFEMAIEEGADVIRVGEAIFGRRSTADGYYWPDLS